MRVCVFCGSSPGRGERYTASARSLGRALARRGIGLVYGGASVGTMGELADATLAAGGEVVGVIPQQLREREIAHHGVTELHVVADMHERKALLARLSDGFIALPGGAGTLEELFEVWTWRQLGLHRKPIALLDVADYYRPLRRFLDHMVEEEFLEADSRDSVIVDARAESLLERLLHQGTPPTPETPVDRSVEPAAAEPPVLDVLAWTHVRQGRLLVVRTHGARLFYLPGGKREPGESDAAAVAREVKEETSVVLDPTSIVPFTVVHEEADGYPKGTRVRLACFFAEYTGRLAESGEIAELAWLGYEDRARCAPGVRLVMDRLWERGLVE